MKILVVTQKVDRTDPILGFFHRWIEELAKHSERVSVIGQFVGELELPANVRVYSLGKETGRKRFFQVLRFWNLQWKLRSEYDRVFVHMTPIWVILGWDKWMLMRKPMYLWYEARGTRWPLKIALFFVRKVFSASGTGMPIKTPKSVITGHGIDVDRFVPDAGKHARQLFVSVGRITKAKRIEVLLQALKRLPEEYVLMLIGEPRTKADEKYHEYIENQLREQYLTPRVVIRPFPQDQVVSFLQSAAAFLHASETALDKAVLEAMACGCPVVSTNLAVHAVLPDICRASDETMANKVQYLLDLSEGERKNLQEDLRRRVVQEHSLSKLIERLITEMM